MPDPTPSPQEVTPRVPSDEGLHAIVRLDNSSIAVDYAQIILSERALVRRLLESPVLHFRCWFCDLDISNHGHTPACPWSARVERSKLW